MYNKVSSAGGTSPQQRLPWTLPRGGVTLMNEEEEDEDVELENEMEIAEDEPEILVEPMEDEEEEDEEEEEEDDEEELDNEEEEETPSIITAPPVDVIFQSNLGSAAVDTKVEMTVSRSKTMAEVKLRLSRGLPGKPPVEMIRLMYEGEILQDDQLMDELAKDHDDNDDDDDEEEEDEDSRLVITLDMIPPVDKKFATELHLNDMSTEEVIQAYTANEASLYHNSQLSMKEDVAEEDATDDEEEFDDVIEDSSESISIKLRHDALRIREFIVDGSDEQVLAAPPPSVAEAEASLATQRRGQRYRPAGGSGGSHMRQHIQRNFNVHWGESIRNFMLFLFFGFFGGRNTFSKNFLLLCAPLSFLIQMRPFKVAMKLFSYTMANPPGIVLSMLPAPQQAILSFDYDAAEAELYGITQRDSTEQQEEEEEVDDDVQLDDNDEDDEEYDD